MTLQELATRLQVQGYKSLKIEYYEQVWIASLPGRTGSSTASTLDGVIAGLLEALETGAGE